MQREKMTNLGPCMFCRRNVNRLRYLPCDGPYHNGGLWVVYCENESCRAVGPKRMTKEDAVQAWWDPQPDTTECVHCENEFVSLGLGGGFCPHCGAEYSIEEMGDGGVLIFDSGPKRVLSEEDE